MQRGPETLKSQLQRLGVAGVPVTTFTDQDLVGWIIKGLAGLVMFLLALGIKDIRERLRDAERMCGRLEVLEEKIIAMEKTLRDYRKD